MRRFVPGVLVMTTVFSAGLSSGCSDKSGPRCGDGVIDTSQGEECDGRALGGMRCTDLGYYSGALGCHPSSHELACTFDTSTCVGPECGNGIIDPGEECDGFEMGGQSCLSRGFDGGQLRCIDPGETSECMLDLSGCLTSPFCGDGTADLNTGEQCDGNDLAGETCETQGYIGGSLRCDMDCRYDVSQCTTPVCGNDTREATEMCDGTDLDGETCVTMGWIQGNLACEADCSAFDETDCSGIPVCGNGVVEGLETCDGTEMGTTTCMDLGYLFGDLSCYPVGDANECRFDESECVGSGNCTVDHMLGVLQSGVPATVNSDLTTAADSNTLDCNLMGMSADHVIAFSLTQSGTLTVDVVIGGMFPIGYIGLYSAGTGACTDNELSCQQTMAPETLDFGQLAAGTYYIIFEVLMPGPYTLTLNYAGGEICDNGVDDNGNGLVDCEDGAQCCGQAACQGNPDLCILDGATCTADASCAGGICLDETSTGFPGGLCTSDCSVTLQCTGNFLCMNYSSSVQGVCGPTCPNGLSSECPDGFLCYDLGSGSMVCVPDCTDNAQCPTVGTCDVASGLCGTGTALAPDGQPCTSYADCAGGYCFTTAPDGGYCSSPCSLTSPVCPGDGVCVDYFLTPADDGRCLDGCQVQADCRATGYTCGPNPNNPPPTDNVCYW